MANIFALQGLSNAGKSSTLIELLNQLVHKYPNAKVQVLHRGTRDIKVIVDPVNGLKVGIESRGDPNSRLQQSLVDFRNANCDTVFCACRTSGMTVDWVNAMAPPDVVMFVVQSAAQTGLQAANTAKAKHLMQLAGI
jgi:hypothetical protein